MININIEDNAVSFKSVQLPTIAKLMYKDCVEEIPGAV